MLDNSLSTRGSMYALSIILYRYLQCQPDRNKGAAHGEYICIQLVAYCIKVTSVFHVIYKVVCDEYARGKGNHKTVVEFIGFLKYEQAVFNELTNLQIFDHFPLGQNITPRMNKNAMHFFAYTPYCGFYVLLITHSKSKNAV